MLAPSGRFELQLSDTRIPGKDVERWLPHESGRQGSRIHPAFRLMLIVLSTACGAQSALPPTALPRGQAIVPGHYGLRGMPERAALIGGKLTVWSEVGAGMEVELRLPGNIVYATSRRRSWLSRLFASKSPASV